MKKDGGPSSAESKLHESHDHDKKSVEVDVTKDTGPVTPNQPPAVVMPEDLARFAALLEAIKSKIQYAPRNVGLVHGDSHSPAMMGEKPSGAEKSASIDKVNPEFEALLKKVEALEKQALTPKGLASAESKFGTTAIKAVDNRDSREARFEKYLESMV